MSAGHSEDRKMLYIQKTSTAFIFKDGLYSCADFYLMGVGAVKKMGQVVIGAVQFDEAVSIRYRPLDASIGVDKAKSYNCTGVDHPLVSDRHDFFHGDKTLTANWSWGNKNTVTFWTLDANDFLVVSQFLQEFRPTFTDAPLIRLARISR